MSLCTTHHQRNRTQWPPLICWTPTLMSTEPRDHDVLRQWQVSAVSLLRLMLLNIYAAVLPSDHMVREKRNLSNSSFPLKRKHQKENLWWKRSVSNKNMFLKWQLGGGGISRLGFWTDEENKTNHITAEERRGSPFNTLYVSHSMGKLKKK